MKFTQKNLELTEDEKSWRYESQLQRSKIRTLLLKEQMSFCAYSEKYLSNKSDLSFLTAIEKAFGLQASFEAEGLALRPLLPSTPKEEERLEPIQAALSPPTEETTEGKTEETP